MSKPGTRSSTWIFLKIQFFQQLQTNTKDSLYTPTPIIFSIALLFSSTVHLISILFSLLIFLILNICCLFFSAFFLFRVQDLIKHPDVLLGTQHRLSTVFSAKVQSVELWHFMTWSLLSMHCPSPRTLIQTNSTSPSSLGTGYFYCWKYPPLLSLIYTCFPVRV